MQDWNVRDSWEMDRDWQDGHDSERTMPVLFMLFIVMILL